MTLSAGRAQPASGQPRCATPDERVVRYRRDGFCVLRGALPLQRIEAVRAQVHGVFRRLLAARGHAPGGTLGGHSMLADLRTLFDSDLDAYRSAARLAPKLLAVSQVLLSDGLLGLVGDVGLSTPSMPSHPVLHVMSDGLRFPGGYHGVPAHQDWPSIKGSADEVVVWLPLVDVDLGLFPLQVIPGSHRDGVLPGVDGVNAREVDSACFDESDFVSVEMDRGDVLLLSSLTVHRTAPVASRGLRVAVSTRFDNTADELFVRNGYPCAYTRGVQRDLVTKATPTAADARRLFVVDPDY